LSRQFSKEEVQMANNYMEKRSKAILSQHTIEIKNMPGIVAQAYNASYLGGRVQKDGGSRQTLTKSSQDLISTNG
jgi:hypothetical protein